MSMFTLPISGLTTSNSPWFMDLTFQVPMQYCSLQHWTLLPSQVTSTAGCWFCFGSVSSLFRELFLHSSWVLGTYQPGEFIFQCHTFLPFHGFHGVLKARILKWFAIPFCSGPRFVRTLHHDPSRLNELELYWGSNLFASTQKGKWANCPTNKELTKLIFLRKILYFALIYLFFA